MHSGTALCAVEPCTSSNDYHRPNFSFVLHLSTSTPHEPATKVSNDSLASASTETLCLISLRHSDRTLLGTIPRTPKQHVYAESALRVFRRTPTWQPCRYSPHHQPPSNPIPS